MGKLSLMAIFLTVRILRCPEEKSKGETIFFFLHHQRLKLPTSIGVVLLRPFPGLGLLKAVVCLRHQREMGEPGGIRVCTRSFRFHRTLVLIALNGDKVIHHRGNFHICRQFFSNRQFAFCNLASLRTLM